MTDRIEKIGSSVIQHGPDNSRIYLMKFSDKDMPDLPEKLEALADREGYTKIFCKVPLAYQADFLSRGYKSEASIPDFFGGKVGVVFLGKFLDPDRGKEAAASELKDIIDVALRARSKVLTELPDEYTLRSARLEEAGALADLYGQVFKSYPFPINDAGYVKDTMRKHVRYFVAEYKGTIVAASSGEMDVANKNTEMTDFAALSDHRGNSLATHLLRFMETRMREEGIITLYTIARALSPGINIAFARCAYNYSGTLVNNTNIAGGIESMNIWYKSLRKRAATRQGLSTIA